jgi:hypothetical protein
LEKNNNCAKIIILWGLQAPGRSPLVSSDDEGKSGRVVARHPDEARYVPDKALWSAPKMTVKINAGLLGLSAFAGVRSRYERRPENLFFRGVAHAVGDCGNEHGGGEDEQRRGIYRAGSISFHAQCAQFAGALSTVFDFCRERKP